jgi:hypothetical protein
VPKVFVSYSHDIDEHKNWVFELAARLRRNGVDVIFDQFEARLGSDLPLFMEQGLSNSNRVICVCSDNYIAKANAGSSGVGYEKRIISSELMRDSSSAWVIPIIRNCSSQDRVPAFLRGLRYLSFEDDQQYASNYYELLRDLHDQSNLPPLGNNPFQNSTDIIDKVDGIIQVKRSLASSTSDSGRARFNYISNSGVHVFGSGLHEFRTNWSDCGSDSVYAYSDGVKAIAHADPSFDFDTINLELLDFSSRVRVLRPDEHVIWVNTHGRVMVTKLIGLNAESDQAKWAEVEYKILDVIT